MEEKHTELMDLAADGTLVRIAKHRFGPVPAWRTEFVEPEEIWLLGTSHLAAESASDVERVVRALMPDNVVVELCRSRSRLPNLQTFYAYLLIQMSSLMLSDYCARS